MFRKFLVILRVFNQITSVSLLCQRTSDGVAMLYISATMTSIPILSAFVLGLMTIIDPCTLFTSIAAIGYIDKQVNNKRRVVVSGTMFVIGKTLCYCALSIPFLMGSRIDGIQHFIEHYGEPTMAVLILLCGIFMLISGHLHHHHDHGFFSFINSHDDRLSWLWALLMGVFFAVAFCPHRLIYFLTMIDIAVLEPAPLNALLPVIFSLGTGLPVMIVALLLSYSATGIAKLTSSVTKFEKWFRYSCAVLFIVAGVYLTIHSFVEHDHHHAHPTSEPTAICQ